MSRKNKMLMVLLFIGISILTVMPFLLEHKINVNDDFLFHKNRLLSYYHSVMVNKDFHPMIFDGMAKGYGYATDLFYPSYSLLPFVLFYSLGLGFIASYYLLIGTYTFATLLVGFYAAQHFFKNRRTALLATVVYACSTYRLGDLFIRGDLGEAGAFIFLPLVILGFYKVYKNEKHGILTLALGLGLVTSIHPMTTLICVYIIGLINVYVLIKKEKSIEFVKRQFDAYLFAIILASATVFPVLEQMASEKYNFMGHHSLWGTGLDFSLSKLVYGSMSNAAGVWNNSSPNVGPLLMLAVIVGLFMYKSSLPIIKRLLIITILFMVGSTNLLIWPMLKDSWFSNIQFEWRILIFATLFGSLLLAKMSETNQHKYFKSLIFLILMLAMTFNFSVSNNFKANNLTLTNQNITKKYNTAIGGGLDYLPKDINYKALREKKSSGSFDFDQLTIVVFPKIYYKGYVIQTDKNKTIPTYASHGLVAAKILPGKMVYQVVYKKTLIQKVSGYITLLSWLAVGIYLGFIWKRPVVILGNKGRKNK